MLSYTLQLDYQIYKAQNLTKKWTQRKKKTKKWLEKVCLYPCIALFVHLAA